MDNFILFANNICQSSSLCPMNEEFESDSNGFLPSNILAYITILSLIGVILHSCAAKYMYRNFNMSKPIYKLMLSACISGMIGLILCCISSICLLVMKNDILCVLFDISLKPRLIIQFLVLFMSILRLYALWSTNDTEHLAEFQNKAIIWMAPLPLSYFILFIPFFKAQYDCVGPVHEVSSLF